MNTTEVPCVSCGFPVYGFPGDTVSCPMCGTSGTISGISGVEVPNVIFWGGLGFFLGWIASRSKFLAGKLSKY